MGRISSSYAFGVLIFCSALPLSAQESIITDRPDRTESAFIVPVKKLQIEAGLASSDDFGLRSTETPTALLRYALTEKFELRLESTIATVGAAGDRRQGLVPLELGFKYNFLTESGWIPQTAIIVHTWYTDLAAEAERTGDFGSSIVGTFSYALKNDFALGFNIGLENQTGADPSTYYTLALGRPLAENLGMYVEAFGFSRDGWYRDNRAQFGFTYLLSPWQQLDISVGSGLSPNSPGAFVTAGFSFVL